VIAGPIAWPAPAKLNLSLRIVGRRDDGYHLLQSVFQFIDIADYLTFTPRTDGLIRRLTTVPGVAEDTDLVVRAARLLQTRCGAQSKGVDIRLEKHLPMVAGLGGGSSDAATTLLVLNRMWRCGLDTAALLEIGLELGADVPIFLHGRSAWAEGIGERLTDLDLPEPVYLLLLPDCHVDTGKVFQDPELTRNSPPQTIRAFLAGERANDCLQVVRKRHPQVAQAFDWLAGRGLNAQLTGTGSTVFAECDDDHAAVELQRAVPASIRSFIVRGRNRSPLHDALAEN
jgi:4-diphosphocytidyl-2-C-methyl-D-erythritol kinase